MADALQKEDLEETPLMLASGDQLLLATLSRVGEHRSSKYRECTLPGARCFLGRAPGDVPASERKTMKKRTKAEPDRSDVNEVHKPARRPMPQMRFPSEWPVVARPVVAADPSKSYEWIELMWARRLSGDVDKEK